MFSMVGAIPSLCMSNNDATLAKDIFPPAVLDVGRSRADRYSLLL